MRGRTSRRFALAGAAGGGLLAGHLLDYVILFSGQDRAHVLAHTGHGYLERAPLLIAFAVGAAVFGALVSGATGRDAIGKHDIARRLAVVQCLSFIALEGTERIVSGAGVAQLLGRITVVGLIIQVLLAVALASVVHLLLRAGRAIAAARSVRPPRSAAIAQMLEGLASATQPLVCAGTGAVRGPPFLS